MATARVVTLFPVAIGQPPATITYSVPSALAPSAGGARNFITGLTAGASYDVSVSTSGSQATVTITAGTQVTADSGGVPVIGG